MFLINLNTEIVACILSFRKSRHKNRHKPNLENTSKYGFSPALGGKNGGVLSMRMQVILDWTLDWTQPQNDCACSAIFACEFVSSVRMDALRRQRSIFFSEF